MIKRIFSLITVLIMITAVAITASAEGLPFDGVEGAPQRIHFLFSYPNEGSENIEAVFTVSDELCRLRSMTSAEQEKHYGSAYECCVQYDWSIDSDSNWHYDETWETAEGDYPFQRLTGSFVEKHEVFWFRYGEAVERCKGAIISGTPPADSEEALSVNKFDFINHKLYIRARFFIYEYSTAKSYTGKWSDTYLVNDYFEGKSAGKYKGDEKGVSPDVSSVRLEGDTVTFNISFDDSTKEQAYLLKCSGNPDFAIESQVRLNGGEWSYWITGNELYPYLVGINRLKFNDSHFEGKIEYRCRLVFSEVNELPSYNSGWSDIITVENGEAVIIENDDPFDEKANDAVKSNSDECGVCGKCPFHPFGICMFIWIGIALIIVAIVVYNVISVRKKKKKQAEIFIKEQESRKTEEKKEESIINIDLTPKIKTEDKENGGN